MRSTAVIGVFTCKRALLRTTDGGSTSIHRLLGSVQIPLHTVVLSGSDTVSAALKDKRGATMKVREQTPHDE